jgi:hypothetical protein
MKPNDSGRRKVMPVVIIAVVLSSAALVQTGFRAGPTGLPSMSRHGGDHATSDSIWNLGTSGWPTLLRSSMAKASSNLLEIVETGLPVNTTWSFWVWSCTSTSCGAESGPSNQSVIIIGQAPVSGLVQWGVSEVPGYVPYPASGVFSPSNTSWTVDVTYLALSAHECSIGVAESGLSLGTTWWAQVAGFDYYSSGTLLYALVGCGTFAPISFGSDSGWQPSPTNLTLFVSVEESQVTGVAFLPPPAQPGVVLPIAVLTGGILVAVAAGTGYLLGRRDRVRDEPPVRSTGP